MGQLFERQFRYFLSRVLGSVKLEYFYHIFVLLFCDFIFFTIVYIWKHHSLIKIIVVTKAHNSAELSLISFRQIIAPLPKHHFFGKMLFLNNFFRLLLSPVMVRHHCCLLTLCIYLLLYLIQLLLQHRDLILNLELRRHLIGQRSLNLSLQFLNFLGVL